MDGWIKPVVVALSIAFFLGGVQVLASDGEQTRRIAEIEKEARAQAVEVQKNRDARIETRGDIKRIKSDIDKILQGIEELKK